MTVSLFRILEHLYGLHLLGDILYSTDDPQRLAFGIPLDIAPVGYICIFAVFTEESIFGFKGCSRCCTLHCQHISMDRRPVLRMDPRDPVIHFEDRAIVP